MKTLPFVLVAALAGGAAHASPRAAAMAKVGPGEVRTAYVQDPSQPPPEVPAFWLDRTPVTNADFLAFVKAQPKWRRDHVKALYADAGYLSHWAAPLRLGQAPLKAPVTHVSWFAARAYCKAQGKRLPTEREWEVAAAAGATVKDATLDPAFVSRILAWYSRPTPKVLPDVGGSEPNAWGVQDLHEVVWEWVDDFGNTLVTSDSRENDSPDRAKFCGAAAVGAGDKNDYAAFMRTAFRSSLKGPYTVRNLGFRCARSLDAKNGASR